MFLEKVAEFQLQKNLLCSKFTAAAAAAAAAATTTTITTK